MKPPPDLIRRQQATQATLNKFKGKPFDWAKGHHCAALLRFHLKKAGRAVPPLPPMRNVLAAQRELAARSCADMADILSKVMKLEPISAAQMLPGDLVAVASECGTGSVLVYAGQNKVFGWSEAEPRLVVWAADMAQFQQAFRV